MNIRWGLFITGVLVLACYNNSMHTSLEQLLATSDLSDDQKELLREEISHATEQQQMLWYVLLRGMDRSDVRALCDVFALKKKYRLHK